MNFEVVSFFFIIKQKQKSFKLKLHDNSHFSIRNAYTRVHTHLPCLSFYACLINTKVVMQDKKNLVCAQKARLT